MYYNLFKILLALKSSLQTNSLNLKENTNCTQYTEQVNFSNNKQKCEELENYKCTNLFNNLEKSYLNKNNNLQVNLNKDPNLVIKKNKISLNLTNTLNCNNSLISNKLNNDNLVENSDGFKMLTANNNKKASNLLKFISLLLNHLRNNSKIIYSMSKLNKKKQKFFELDKLKKPEFIYDHDSKLVNEVKLMEQINIIKEEYSTRYNFASKIFNDYLFRIKYEDIIAMYNIENNHSVFKNEFVQIKKYQHKILKSNCIDNKNDEGLIELYELHLFFPFTTVKISDFFQMLKSEVIIKVIGGSFNTTDKVYLEYFFRYLYDLSNYCNYHFEYLKPFIYDITKIIYDKNYICINLNTNDYFMKLFYNYFLFLSFNSNGEKNNVLKFTYELTDQIELVYESIISNMCVFYIALNFDKEIAIKYMENKNTMKTFKEKLKLTFPLKCVWEQNIKYFTNDFFTLFEQKKDFLEYFNEIYGIIDQLCVKLKILL